MWETREIERLGIGSAFCSDGPHGLRKQSGEGGHLGINESLPATYFPTAASVANRLEWQGDMSEVENCNFKTGISIAVALPKDMHL